MAVNFTTTLVDAVYDNDMRAVCRCLDGGADPNTKVGPKNNIPLVLSPYGKFDGSRGPIVAELINAGADLKARHPDGNETILHQAAEHNWFEIVHLAVDRHLSVNLTDKNGNTPLHVAVARGAWSTVEFLIRSGAEVWANNEDGQTPADRINPDYLESPIIEVALKEAMLEKKPRARAGEKKSQAKATVRAVKAIK